MNRAPTPLVLGVSGPRLTDMERAYLAENPPAGFLLFARNIENIEQTAELCAEMKSVLPHAYIAVDQEGGKVQRLTFGGKHPPAQVFGAWYAHNPAAAEEACELNAMLLAAQLRAVGANWVMGPVLDLLLPQTHGVIGNRAFSALTATVSVLGAAFGRGVERGGCYPCMKHAPGHGRAMADSHHELPIVEATRAELEDDFVPFKTLAPHMPFLMTAHIRFPALDAVNPATTSPAILKMMRDDWGFNGLIMADDVGMEALAGTYTQRITNALEAGCDLVIAALSRLKHGMAGTVFDEESFTHLVQVRLPSLSAKAQAFMAAQPLPDAPDAEAIAFATHKLRALWADGPARMGYDLKL